MTNGYGLDSRERGFRCRLCGADDALEPGAPRSFGYGQCAGHGSDSPVEGELANCSVLGEALGRELSGRSENGKRDRQIEARALFPQGGRSKIDRYSAVERPFERRGHDPAPNPMLRLLAGAIGKPDDREPRHAGLQMRLDLDLPRLETDEGMSDCACEHPRDGRCEGATRG
jgi:hypothetical protein